MMLKFVSDTVQWLDSYQTEVKSTFVELEKKASTILEENENLLTFGRNREKWPMDNETLEAEFMMAREATNKVETARATSASPPERPLTLSPARVNFRGRRQNRLETQNVEVETLRLGMNRGIEALLIKLSKQV